VRVGWEGSVRARAHACACINESRKNQSLLNMALAIKTFAYKISNHFIILLLKKYVTKNLRYRKYCSL